MMSEDRTKETEIDEKIRLFFLNQKPFQLSKKVMELFFTSQESPHEVGKNSEEDSEEEGEEREDSFLSPLLIRKQNDDDDDAPFSYLYSPLFGCDESPAKSTLKSDHQDEIKDQYRPKRRHRNFKITIAYQGGAYCGWQNQPNNVNLPSVQGMLVDILDPILGRATSTSTSTRVQQQKKKKYKPIDVRVCGRTDAGVSAVAQSCRVRTLNQDISPVSIQNVINGIPSSPNTLNNNATTLWCTNVEEVDDKFHPTFDATCRAYAYFIDSDALTTFTKDDNGTHADKAHDVNTIAYMLNAMLMKLEGVELNYFALSYGKVKTETTLCTMFRSRASTVQLSNVSQNDAVCIELVGDRFLRRMVRILVATALREVIDEITMIQEEGSSVISSNHEWENRLLNVIQDGQRELSAKAAPSFGLIFVGAAF